MMSRASSPRRLQSQNSIKKEEKGMDSPLHTGRQPLRAIPEASASRSSSASEQTEPGSPSRPSTPRGKKRAAAVYRQSENVDGNLRSASNSPEKPREKRTTLTRVSKVVAPLSSKLPVTASLARSLQESLQQTDAANKSWDSDSIGGTPTTSIRTPLIPITGASKSGSTEQISRTFKFSGKPPLDSELSRTCFGSSNSSFLQSTPSRSVNRSLRYGATPGSVASIGSSRASGSGTKSSGPFHFSSGQQFLAQQFDFEEDPAFWEDHNVQVILRTRPISTSESAFKGFSRCVRQENSHSITWIGQPECRFTFDHVAGDHITQEKLFRVAGVPMVENCMAGYNSCMFCYGQTGSGKTHTMLGDIVDLEQRPSDDRGITPRVFEYLFSKIQKEEESRTDEHLKYVCKCSFLEIFNEQISDLLEPSSTNLQVREGGRKGVYVENLSEVAVGSVQDVVHLLLLGAANRKVAATNMNRESSRSHSVFTCTIESKWEFNSATNIRFGRLNLVDLAGSERQKSSGAEGERLKEAANINKSLSTLGLVIMILVDVANGKQRHVPYRDSKLTYLLQDSLGGNSKTTMIANISPSSCCALETLSTLKFAQRAKFIRNNAVVNEDASGDVNGLRQEIQELKEELDRIRRQELHRTPSMHSVASASQVSVQKGDDNAGMAVVAIDEQEQSRCSIDAREFTKAYSGPRFPNKKLEAMEAVLAGALRREQEAELSQKRQAAEIEQLTRLVKQREDDSQCGKMLLRFREDKIRRLEALSTNVMSADMYLRQENDLLMHELWLIQEKSDRNPELTRFAMENIRLLEQLRRFQDFYTGGEREAMADEISNLRDQLLEVLDSKLSLTALTSPQKEALAPELAAAQREIELLRIETDNYRREVEDCRKNLSSILEANSRITKQLDESNAELRTVKSKNQVHQEELQKFREQALDAESIEWGHSQHLELISQLKTKLQQSEDRADLEASLRFELDRQLNVSLEEAADLHSDLQETKGVLDAAEMLVSCLQSTESNLSVAQEMATLARNAVKQIYLEAKEIADDQRLSLKHSVDAVVAACSKETELREELEDARSLIQKLVSIKDEKVCSSCSVASVTAEEQVHGILVSNRTVDVRQLEQELKSLDIFAEHGCRDLITNSTESAIEEMEHITKVCDETPMTQKKQFRCLDPGTECILKLNFTQKSQTGDDGSLSEVEPDTTRRELQSAESIISPLQGDQDLQVFQGNSINHVDLELVLAVLSLQDEIMKLKPQVVRDERKEAATKWSTIELVKELQSLVLVVQAVLGEKKNLATQNEALLKEKNIATKAHQEWEAATTRLMEHLNEGEHALTDAVHEMEGILDDCLSLPTALDNSRVREREHVNVRQLDLTTTLTAERKDTDQSREAVGNDHSNGVERNFAVCTTMLQWFSETLTAERAAKRTSRMQNDHAKEELRNKDYLITSLQKQLERALASSVEKDSSVSKLQTEYDEDRARVMKADAQTAAAIRVDAELRYDIENHCLEPATVLTRMDDTELELALMQDVLTRLRTDLIGSNMERDKLALEKEQLAGLFSNDGKVLERSYLVAATMVWWLQTKIAGDEKAHKLNYDDISSQVRDIERTVLSLRDEIAEKTMLLKEQMGNEEIHAHQSLEHMQEIDSTRKEILEKDSLINVMQTSVLRLQDELSASEGQSMQLVMEKEKLQIKLREVTEKSEALQGVVSSVKRELKEAETKVVELAIVQAGMLIVQEEWGLEKDGLERDSSEAKQRCTQIVQELELARKEALKFESELEEAKTQEMVLRVEKDKLVTSLQEELKRTQTSAEVFKEQLELNQTSMIELHSRLQKQLGEWEIEKETMSSAAALAHDKCLEKDQALTSMQTCLATLQSQLFDACSRESKLSHELEQLLQSKENTQCENEMLRSKTEELVLVLNRQGQEVNSLKQVLEMKLQIVDDKAEDTYRQMKAILVDLDALILVKEKLEADAESLERKILHHCSSLEQKLVNINEDKNQLEELWSVRETELIAGLNTVQSENTSFVVLVQALEDALETSRIQIKKKEEEITVLQRHLTESESKAVKTQEKLRSSNLLMKDLARSEEQLKLQTDALAAENKRLTRCMACREMEFSSLQGQIEGLEKSLKESHEKESMASMTLCKLKENLKVLEKQWRIEREQMKDRLSTANRKLLESQEMKQSFYSALKELEGEILATEKKCKVTIGELETQWSIARGDMSNHLNKISLDFVEVRSCAEETHLDLAKTQSLLSAADAAIEQLLDKSSALKDSNDELLVKQEALQLELSRWERYAVELQRSSCYFPSLCNDNNAIADSAARSDKNCFDILMTEVEKIRCYCENLRAQVVDKDSTILSIQMELSATVANSRQLEIELTAGADERNDLKLQLDSINRELVNAQDEVKRRDMELKTFGNELHKVIDVLAETEEKMDESSREWRQQIEEVKAEMEDAKLCASGKNRESIVLRKQFEDGQATLQEAESLVNALVRANETAKRDMRSSKWREEKITLQSTELLSMINEEVSVTINYVETQLQNLSLDIHGIKALVTDICSETAADFVRELKEIVNLHISEMQRATEGAHTKLAKTNAKVIDLEQRLNASVVENEALQVSLNRTQDLLVGSQAALEDATQNMEVQRKEYAATRDELQGALASLAGRSIHISELTSECDRLFSRNTELERLVAEKCEELRFNVATSKELELEKLTSVEATEKLQAANNHLHGQLKQLEMSLADAMSTKQVLEMEVGSLSQQNDFHEEKIRKLEVDLTASDDAKKAVAAKLLEQEVTIQALNSDLENSHKEMVYVQRSLDKAVTEVNDMWQLTGELEEKEAHLKAQAETQRHVLKSTSEMLVRSEAEFDASAEILATMLESTTRELRGAEISRADLEENSVKFSSALSSLQVTITQLGQEKRFLLERANALDEDKKSLLDRLETQSKQLCIQSLESSAASSAHELQLEILKSIIESASRELQEKDHNILSLSEKLEQSSACCMAVDKDRKDLLGRLEMQSLELCNLSQEASAASAAHQIELEVLKSIIESASRELQEKDHNILSLSEKLEQSSARCLALDEDKKDLLGRLEIQSLELRNLSQEASAASAAHQIELERLKTIVESATSDMQERDHNILLLREKLEQSSARCLALDEDKKNILGKLEIQSLELRNLWQEASAASAAHQIELEVLKTIIESASTDLLEKDRLTSSLRDNLEKSSAQALKLLNSLETAMLASAQIELERDVSLASAKNLETEKRALREEFNLKLKDSADLQRTFLMLQAEVQDFSTASCKQKLELEILTTMLESAVQESREKDAMASELENLLSQSQLQNAEMLQSSQEVVNHFSLFQSQLDVCFQQKKELETNKLVLTAEVYSLSQELVEAKNLRQASECCLDELRIAFAQLEKQKDEEIRVLSDEVDKLKSQEAAMEVDLWDWEQRCQDAEVQLDEKVSELDLLRGKLVSTQEECKEQLELVYDELRECLRRAAEMDSERRDMIIEIEEGSSIIADLQTKLQARESEMEEHFGRHSIEQEVLDSLEKENRELQSSVKHLTAEVAANQQRATTAENMQVETRLEMEAFERDLKQKNDLLQTLESDLNLLQESALQELRLNQEVDSLRVTTDVLQQELSMQKEKRTRLETEVAQVTEEIVQTKNQAATWKGKAYEFETELDKKRQTIESLEDELRMAEQNMANTLEEATIDLKEVENERDRLQIEVLELTEQLELTQMMVEERDAVVSELHQAGEQSRTQVKEKEDEAKLLTRSVHELESTVYALESQLGLLKREAERQRLLREDIEMESQKLNNHIFVTQSALEESNIRNAEELKDALSALRETERKVEDKEADISHLRRKLENLEIASKDKDVQMKDAMTQISDLLVAAELQKADYQQKLKWMESEVERAKRVNWEIQSASVTSNSNEVATEVVSSEASPAHESYSQRDMTHVSCLSRIKELEELALSRQKELFTLHTRLAEAESMTHDVLRDLLGVKADMNNVVSMLDHQQIKQLAETACRKNVEAEEKETELSSLRSQLDAYMEERQSLVEEVNLRQSEMVAARVAAERLRQKEQVLTDEIEKFRLENINHQENIRELEMEIRKLPTSQQSFNQQINHHAKIKEENQALRLASEELSKELRRTELLYAGVHDELVRYRSAESRSSSSSFDEERLNLHHRLQEAETSQAQAAQKLTSLCSAVIQAAGLAIPETVDAAGAMDALQLLENRLRSSDVEHSNSKYKKKVTGERRRRTDVRAKDSPLRSISNFTELLQRPSSASPAPR